MIPYGIFNDQYTQRAHANNAILNAFPSELSHTFSEPNESNRALMQRIAEHTGLSYETVVASNHMDERLNGSDAVAVMDGLLGCTSIGRNGVIGQTMDLFTVELMFVREGDAIYMTAPPYLAMLGMNESIAFNTNHLFAPVQDGTPISHIRRELLRHHSLDDALTYLHDVNPTTQVNFLLSDGERMVDVELKPEGVRVFEAYLDGGENVIAHTNHLINGEIKKDKSCSRLARATHLLPNTELEAILDDKQVDMGVDYSGIIGFGTIAKVLMDPKNGTLKYKAPKDAGWTSVTL